MSSAPSYSSEPSPNERRLGIAVRSTDAPPESLGTLVTRSNGITIALKNQSKNASRATYGRNASIAGEVSLSTTQGVASVHINLEGKATFVFGTTLIPDLKLIQQSNTLWHADSAEGPCPTSLSFGFVFPEHFVDPESGASRPIPPSYDPLGDSISLQDIHVRCVYRLSVLVARSRWMPNRSKSIDIEYAPRSIPPRALLDAPFPFFDTIKSAPEEWHQMGAILAPKPGAVSEQIYCDFFIPSVRVFTRRDMVPVFLQLRGTSASMVALYAPESQAEQGIARRLLRIAHAASTAPQISISVKRQVVLHFNGTDVARSYIVGTGTMRSVPPGYVPPEAVSDSLSVDYEGEIQFSAGVTVGGFDAGRVRVSDFVVLDIQPLGDAATRFSGVTQTQSIRVVTG